MFPLLDCGMITAPWQSFFQLEPSTLAAYVAPVKTKDIELTFMETDHGRNVNVYRRLLMNAFDSRSLRLESVTGRRLFSLLWLSMACHWHVRRDVYKA